MNFAVKKISIRKNLRFIYFLSFFSLSYSTTVFSVDYQVTGANTPTPPPITLNSSTADTLTVTNTGTLQINPPANAHAVLFNFNSGNATLSVLNQGVIQSFAPPTDALFTTATGVGTGSILITNQAFMAIGGGAGFFFNFTNITVPVLVINEGPIASIFGPVVDGIDLTTGGGDGAILQLGTPTLSGGAITTPISGNVQSVINILNDFTFTALAPVTNVGSILVNNVAATTVNFGTALSPATITGFDLFRTAAGSTSIAQSDGIPPGTQIIGAANATFINLGTFTITDLSTFSAASNLTVNNSGTMNVTGLNGNAIIDLAGGTYNNNSGGTTTLSGAGPGQFGEIVDFTNYNNAAGSTTTVDGDGAIIYLANATINNQGTFTFNNGSTLIASVAGTGVNIINGGLFTINTGASTNNDPITSLNNSGTFNLGSTISVVGTGFTNTGTFNVNNAGILTDQNNSGFTNAGILTLNAGGTIITPSLNNNGTFNIHVATVTFPITSSSANGVINLFADFTTSNTISNNTTISLVAPATTFTIQNAITGLHTLNMPSALMETIVNPGGSITTSTLVVNGSGTLTMNGGTLQGNLSGSATSTLSITSNFSSQGSISIGTISVAPTGIFNVNNPLTYTVFSDAGSVILNPGASLSGAVRGNGPGSSLTVNTSISTNGIWGDVLPLGLLTINNGHTLTMNHTINATSFVNNGVLHPVGSQTVNGNYTQTASGQFFTNITSTSTFDRLFVNGIGTVGGIILANPVIQSNTLPIQTGDTFDVIVATTLVDNNPSVQTTPNPFITFVRDRRAGTPPNVIRLLAIRTPFSFFVSPENRPAIGGVAQALSQVNLATASPALRNAILTLQRVTNLNTLQEDLSQLIPDISGALIMPTLMTQDLLLDKVADRMDRARLRRLSGYTAGDVLGDYGYAAGDMSDARITYGPYFFGNILQQDSIGLVDGYNARTGGIGVLADFPVNKCGSRIGAAFNYAQSSIRSLTTGNSNTIYNYQGTLYGCFEYGWLYIDGMLSLAANYYRTHRNIAFLGQSATAEFNGIQKNGMVTAGFNIPIWRLQITPMLRFQYTLLNIDQYTETGNAPTLTVVGRQEKLYSNAYGFKLMDISEPDFFLPEIHMFFYNFGKNPSLQVTSNFTGGGPAFVATGFPLSKTGTNIGAGLTVRLNPNLIFTARYDFLYRNTLKSNSLLLIVRYLY